MAHHSLTITRIICPAGSAGTQIAVLPVVLCGNACQNRHEHDEIVPSLTLAECQYQDSTDPYMCCRLVATIGGSLGCRNLLKHHSMAIYFAIKVYALAVSRLASASTSASATCAWKEEHLRCDNSCGGRLHERRQVHIRSSPLMQAFNTRV